MWIYVTEMCSLSFSQASLGAVGRIWKDWDKELNLESISTEIPFWNLGVDGRVGGGGSVPS